MTQENSPSAPGSDERHDPAESRSHSHRPVVAAVRGLRHAADIDAIISPESPKITLAQRRALYRQMVVELRTRYKIAIRKWRTHMSGVAYELKYPGGAIRRMITAPRPKSPVSAAIFLHEVGHHAIGFRRYSPRCLEEYYVWQWAFREMVQRNIPITPRVLAHYRRSMYHYVHLARKRGVRDIPHELHQFQHWPG
jgi:hypothetical protein